MTIALRSGFQRLRVQALVAVFLATQFWEWYPLFHVVVKAFAPTALLAVDASLRLPREVRWVCEAAPSRFEYVAMLAKEEKTAKKEEVTFSFQQPQHAPEEVKEKEVKKEEPIATEARAFVHPATGLVHPVPLEWEEDLKMEKMRKTQARKRQMAEDSQTVLSSMHEE